MFYLFHGDDRHSQRKTLADLMSSLGDPAMLELNTNRFEGKRLTMADLQHACDSIPFLSEKRVVIVEDLWADKPAFTDDLLAYLPNLPESTRLIFLESRTLPKSHPMVKLAESDESGYVKSFSTPEGARLEGWIRQKVEEQGGQITPQATHLLALSVGSNLTTLDNEVEKLILYKGRAPIEAEDVALLCPYVAEASIFDLVDAIGSRHGRSAANLLQHKLDEGTDPFYLFAMIVRQFRLLIQVKELAKAGLNPQRIAQTIKIHNFVAGKLVQQSHNFSLEQLESIYAHLLDIDVGVKTGKTDMVTAINLLVAGVTV